mmetsp:Transcript_18461/g.40934  ORF Transcript_18461/g.40934 Transcript_18461/m.40934 type:complete len:182 (+) Transcript_18461:87-632(+)
MRVTIVSLIFAASAKVDTLGEDPLMSLIERAVATEQVADRTTSSDHDLDGHVDEDDEAEGDDDGDDMADNLDGEDDPDVDLDADDVDALNDIDLKNSLGLDGNDLEVTPSSKTIVKKQGLAMTADSKRRTGGKVDNDDDDDDSGQHHSCYFVWETCAVHEHCLCSGAFRRGGHLDGRRRAG